MKSNRFVLLICSVVTLCALSITANAGEVIKDRSPDGRFALLMAAAEEDGPFGMGLIETETKKELVHLGSVGNPYAQNSHLIWSPDSKRVAYNEDNRRGGDATVYQQKGSGFEEVKLPQLPSCEAKHVLKVYEASLVAERWLNANTLTVVDRSGWTAENGEDGECEKTVTIKFDAKGKASIQNVRTVSARDLAARAKAEKLFENGATKSSNGDRSGAIADYTRAIKLDPKNVDAYNNRGTERQINGDIAGAMADFNRAIEINPLDPDPYYNRGGIYFLKRDWKKAISDLRHHDELNAEDEDAPPIIWAAQIKIGEKEAADRELARFVADHPQPVNAWNAKIDNFLLGKINDQELLAAMDALEGEKQSEQQCGAWFYLGEKRLFNGDKTGAVEAFRKSVATEEKNCNEYDFAKAELKGLGQ